MLLWNLLLFNCVWLSATPRIAACQVPLSSTFSQSLLQFMSVELVMPSNHLILCRPLLLLPSAFPSIRVFSNESALCIRWPKYWSFSFSPSNEYSGLISFRNDWFDLAVQRTLKSFLQHHSSKASKRMILWKCCTHYASKFGKLSRSHRTGKGQFSFQSQRKAMPKNAQTTAQLHSSHMLVK